MEPYADVIIDLSVKNVDRIFQYRIPDHLKELVKPGVQVNIPFGKGNTERKGIVVGLSKETDYDPEKMKDHIRQFASRYLFVYRIPTNL